MNTEIAKFNLQYTRTSYFTSWPREANSSIVCLMLMYCDPPRVIKPTIRAGEPELTASNSKSNENRAIFLVVVP